MLQKIWDWLKSGFKGVSTPEIDAIKTPLDEPAAVLPTETKTSVAKPTTKETVYQMNRKEDVIPFAIQSPRRMKEKGKYAKGYPLGAVVHFTAGRDGAQKTIDGGIGNGYTFLCIQKDGQIVQAHKVSQWGYHAGESAWAKFVKKLSGAVTDDLIGIEINAAGRVDKQKDGTYKTWFDTYIAAKDVRVAPKDNDNIQAGAYEKYTLAQERTLVRTLFWLKSQAEDIFDFDFVLGHDEVAGKKGIGRSRKNDPGAALSGTMTEFRTYLKEMYPLYRDGKAINSFTEWLGGAPSVPGPVITPPATYPSGLSKRKMNVLSITKGLGYASQGERLIAFWAKSRDPRYYMFIDYGMPDTKKRAFLIDAEEGSYKQFLVAHGSGSDTDNNDIAEAFSNKNGSKMSSIGIFEAGETYTGSNGYSLRLDGKESTNDAARERAIVIHAADYVSESKKIAGRSWGCPAFDPSVAKDIIDKLKNGSPVMTFKA